MFINTISEFIESQELKKSKIAVAVSGGADSVALFTALMAVSEKYELSLAVVHVNYQLRSEESEKDHLFVKSLAESHSVAFYSHVAGLHPESSGIEEQARIIRYNFFKEVQKIHGYPFVALGHTRDDQAETVLFRLLRGCSVHGASGMNSSRSDGIIRPMLNSAREECREWLISNGILWREDSSNSENHYKRNLIRNEILPLLQQVNTAAIAHLADFAGHCTAVDNELTSRGLDYLRLRGLWEGDMLFHFEKSGGINDSERFAIAHLLRVRGCSFSEKHFHALEHAGSRSGKVTLLPGGWRVYSSFRRLVFYMEGFSPFKVQNIISLSDESCRKYLHGLYFFDKGDSENRVFFRSVKHEDMFLTSKGKKSVKAYLKKIGVPSVERSHFPVICLDEGIVELAHFSN